MWFKTEGLILQIREGCFMNVIFPYQATVNKEWGFHCGVSSPILSGSPILQNPRRCLINKDQNYHCAHSKFTDVEALYLLYFSRAIPDLVFVF